MYKTFIEDGFTYDFVIKPVPGLHNGLKGKFRPILTDDKAVAHHEIASATKAGNARLAETRVGAATFRQVVSWDLTDSHGREVELTVQNLMRLAPDVFYKLFKICMGQMASEIEAGNEDAQQAVASELDLVLAETTVQKN